MVLWWTLMPDWRPVSLISVIVIVMFMLVVLIEIVLRAVWSEVTLSLMIKFVL